MIVNAPLISFPHRINYVNLALFHTNKALIGNICADDCQRIVSHVLLGDASSKTSQHFESQGCFV